MSTLQNSDDRTLRELSGAIEVQLLHRKLDALRDLPSADLEAMRAELMAELARRTPAPPAPPAQEIEGWRVDSIAPCRPGLWDIEVTDGEHLLRFEACSDGGNQTPLEWAVEQVRAFSPRDFAVVCRHCPDQGDPTRPSIWDEEGA